MLKLDNTSGNHRAAESNLLLPPICDACASTPASLFCKADSASLCPVCDAKIHSANPLARRHHRVAIVPGVNYGVAATDPGMGIGAIAEEVEAASWLLLNPVKNDIDSRSYGTDDPTTFCGVVDEYLDLGDFNYPCHYYNNNNNMDDDDVGRSIGGGDDSSNVGYNYYASMSHTVPFSKLDVGVVPEESTTTMSDNSSISNTKASRGMHDVFAGPLVQMPTQLSAMDREARVLRYREKKKARKFEKRIRYASRKAYAETRPRIKGRFARRASVAEFEVDQLFSASLITEAAGFGIVPSFQV